MDTTTLGDFLERFCLRYEGQLVDYLTQMLGSRERARELAQESFTALHAAHQPERLYFPRAALFKIATNFALMELRRRRADCQALSHVVEAADDPEEVPDPGAGPDRRALAEQVSQHIATAIRALRPTLRTVFVMAHIEGKPRMEIAAALGISVRRVDKQMTRALSTCRKLLESRGVHLTDMLGLVAIFEFVLALHS